MRYSKIYALLLAAMLTAGSVTTATAQSGPTVHGNVYGGGNAADVGADATVNITGGQIGGSTVNAEHGNVFGGGKGQNTTVKGNVSVNIGKAPEGSVTTYTGTGIVKGSVYGGSALGYVNANTTKGTDGTVTAHTANTDKTTQVNVFKGTVKENVYGGGRGEKTTSNDISATSASAVTVTIGANATEAAPAIDGSVYGGSDANGILESDVTLHILNGTIGKAGEGTSFTGGNVYGGGLGLPTLVQGSVIVNIGAAGTTPTGTANILGDVYGGSAKGKVNATKGGTAESPTYSKTDSKTTQVNLYSNTGVRDVYGGGHGLDGASADVYGDVEVNIGATDGASTPTYTGNATINGSVYGCNNASGTPKGDVTVNVYKTAHTDANKYPAVLTDVNLGDESDETYAIKAVYGGGNEAAYMPVATTGSDPKHRTMVRVHGCSENTVKAVYGGGNAANVGTTGDGAVEANTNVIIEGGRFLNVFGGGNGRSTATFTNPGANIYGTATTNVQGGLYNQIFGGSDSKGNITSIVYSIGNSCGNLMVNESFGGANESPISGDVTTTLACGDNIQVGSFYGGSKKAKITGNVTLNVEGGTYTNVFGGSKGEADTPADIEGDVTLNLFGGTMDNAFGGSDVNGNITGKITVNMLNRGTGDCSLTVHNIYGGGRDAEYKPDDATGNYPEVNLIHGSVTKKTVTSGSTTTYTGGNVFGGGKGSTAIVSSNPKVTVGYIDGMSLPTGIASITAANVSVAGDVYGGGEEAAVTGNTLVTVQQGTVEGMTISTAVGGDVYGGGALADVGTSASGTTAATTHQVSIAGGTITGDVYGGGLGRLAAEAVQDNPDTPENEAKPAVIAIPALVKGAVTVNVNGGSVDEVFGCNNLNGAPQSTVEVNITNGNITNVFGGGNQAAYTGVPDVNISGGTITKVFGGGNKAGTGGSDVAINDGTIASGVYGGCNTSGTITGNTTVTLTGGTIGAEDAPAEVCGGGLGKDTKVTNSTSYVYVGTATDVADANTYTGRTTLYGDIYGGSAYGEVDNTEVNLFKLAGTSFGYNVFGGGKGKFVAAGDAGNIEAKVNGTAMVNMYALTIAGDDDKAAVYGGCNVNGTAETAIVNLIAGTIGTSGTEADKVFGGGKGHQTTTNTATVNVGKATTTTGDNPTTTYSGTSYIYSNVYGGSALGAVGTANVNLYDAASLTGDVFGGGMGAGTSDNEDTRATITTMANVALYQLDISTKNIYGGCNVNGSAVATKVDLYGVKDGSTYYGKVNDVFGGGKGHSTSVTGSVNVNVGENTSTGDVTVMGEIYGGSEEGAVNNPIVNIYKAHSLGGSVFGGGKGIDDTATPANNVQATVTGTSKVFMYSNTLTYPIYGGCNANGSSENTEVTILGGTLGTSFTSLPASLDNILFGGGKGKLTSVTGTTKVYVGTKTTTGEGETATTTYDGDANIYGNVYGGSENGGVSAVNVYLYKDVIHGNVFGGGYDTKAQDTNPSATTVNVELDGTAFDCFYGTDENKTPQTGQIFGGNNENGWPTGLSTVHVYKTVAYGTTNVRTADKTNTTYELAAVYGGGNKAKSDANAGTSVIIEGCDATSIASVYGGGNAAYVMNSSVTVKGTYEIGTVFGGGNGTVSAADVKGTATTVLNGGTIHDFYGGSNSQGTIGKYEGGVASGGTDITINDLNLDTDCSLKVDNIYGAGKNANVDGNISMTMGCLSDAYTIQNLYGGAQAADIKGGVTLTVTSGRFDRVFGGNNLSGTIGGDITVNIEETGCKPIIIGQLFGGGNQAAFDHNTQVNVKSCTSIGQVFGGGLGSTAVVKGNTEVNINTTVSDLNKDATNGVFAESTFSFTDEDNNSVTVTIPAHAKDKVGTIGYVYGGGYGANVEGNSEVYIGTSQTDANATYGVNIINNVYGGGYGAATNVLKNVEVTIGAAANTYSPQIGGNVYGGSALGTVNGTELTDTYHTYVTLNKGNVTGTVFGGGQGKEPSSATATDGTETKVYGNAVVTLYGDFVTGGLFGGCDKYGTMHGTAKLDLLGGTVGTPFTTEIPTTGLPEIVFGGGLGAYTTVVGDVTVNVGNGTSTGNCKIYGNVYGGSMAGTAAKINVNLKEGAKIWGNVFGGGYQTDANATAATDVTVTLDGIAFECIYSGTGDDRVPLTGQVFGCNNQEGTPLGHVMVHAKKTKGVDKSNETARTSGVYDVAAIYGGGNQADYTPTKASGTDAEKAEAFAEVLIEGCDKTSIENVYGGGNAAAVPATEVTVKGTYIINKVFGGGNGAGTGNPGANVGKYGTTVYGTGKAVAKLLGGYINSAYGGSNTKGDIVGGTDVQTKKKGEEVTGDCCDDLIIGELYGAGSYATLDGDVNIILECLEDDYVGAVYGGAENAVVNGNVTLTVTSGKFGRVFGGNNAGGSINGIITVNVKEEGCKNLEIGELYGGGNKAPYSRFGCYKDESKWKPYEAKSDANNNFEVTFGENELYPYHIRVFVESCTSIGKIFGGGLGESATVTGDTYVNVNMMYGSVNNVRKDKIGSIGQIFGGGNAGKVTGNTKLDIGTATANAAEDIGVKILPATAAEEVYIDPDNGAYVALTEAGVYGGGLGDKAKVIGNTTVNIGTATQSLGTSITGNIYGGGKEGDVTGNTEVNLCAIKNDNNTPNNPSDDTYTAATLSAAGVTINGNIFGAGKGVETDYTAAMVHGNSYVNMANGAVKGNIYGGGELSSVGDFTYDTSATDVLYVITDCTANTGTSTVNIMGGSVGTSSDYTYTDGTTLTTTPHGNVFAGSKGELKKSDNTYLDNWLKFARVKNTVLNVSGGTIMSNIYGGGEIGLVGYKNSSNALVGSTTVTVSGGIIGTEIKSGTATQYTIGSVFGGGFGSNVETVSHETDTHAPKLYAGRIYGSTSVTMTGGEVKASVYGGGQLASVGATGVGGNAVVAVSGGTVGIDKDMDRDKQFGGATMGNVYGGGSGDRTIVRAGQIFGNTTVTISGTPTIYHNIYGGGAYGSVGDFNYTTETATSGTYANIAKVNGIDSDNPLLTTGTGIANVTVTGGTIGVDGKENGMVFGSSRGDVGTNRDKWQAWVYKTTVVIGDETTHKGPDIMGSVYGSGENGHVYTDTDVKIHGGEIGLYVENDIDAVTGKDYNATRGNVYGGGCGEDTYPSDTEVTGMAGKFEPSAGIVYGTAKVTMTGGKVLHNIYGAGALGSVGKPDVDNPTVIASGGSTIIKISGGIVGYDGNDNGNVFGAARGNAASTQEAIAQVKTTSVTISGTTTTTQIKGSVYGGGQMGDVQSTTAVDVQGGAIAKNVFGGGMGDASTFACAKAMVGIADEGAGADPGAAANINKGTSVIISNGTVGTLNEGTLVEGTGNVYGGGEIARVEWNTRVTIGPETGDGSPDIKGNVFGAGKGLETHGYSALVRGNSTVIVQGGAKVGHDVYGGGEKATVGRYWVKGINNIDSDGKPISGAPEPPSDLPVGMPYQQQSGGVCTVTIQGSAEIGYNGAAYDAGHVFGGGKGVTPHFVAGESKKMTADGYVIFTDDITTGKTAEELHLEFLQTLALATNSFVTINGSAQVKGSVFGGSESGFVQHDTNVTVNNGTIGTTDSYGNVFGGGRGLEEFAEAGKVKGNTMVKIFNGNIYGNVYGGGNLGDVGIIDKTNRDDNGNLTYNYNWKQNDGKTANTAHNNEITGKNNNTGICNVTISGGIIGLTSTTEPSKHGNVFGAGRGSSTTWWCEKAIAYATNVSVSDGTVYGTVYGGGEVGRVEDDAKVTIGTADATGDSKPTIVGSVFGAGAGLHTHGYSALLRGNTNVTVQGTAQVGGSVYGGGETASVGKFTVVGGLPKHLDSGGYCTVVIQDKAKVGSSGIGHNVYGACKGVNPATISAADRKSMQLYANRPKDASGTYKAEGDGWVYYTDENNNKDERFVWVSYTEADYPAFLRTLALTSHPKVTIAEDATVYGSVYGGGERGITLGNVEVEMTGGTVEQDVYGGGALADTNTGNWDASTNSWATDKIDADGKTAYKTTVNLTGGYIKGDAYGGGLGQKNGFNGATSNIEAMVYGDVDVTLDGTKFDITYYDGKPNVVKSGRVFGANNLNGSPLGYVTVTVNKTVEGNTKKTAEGKKKSENDADHSYELAAVYGGGNLAPYTAKGKKTHVIVHDCENTSILTVYGGGNAAGVPETDVDIYGAYEIGAVFGGGNGKDPYTTDGGTTWVPNPGANVGKTLAGASIGSGNAVTILYGGLIHEAYGGSNENGTISGNVSITTAKTGGDCKLDVGTIYGAGKNADIEGDLITILGCKEARTEVVYGGAENANVKGNVELTITSGEFGKVFGGNNTSGSIFGSIKLNIMESGCSPIEIDELYLGGYNAAYSVYGYYRVKADDSGVFKDEYNNIFLDEAKTVLLYKGADDYLYLDDEMKKPVYKPRTSATDSHKAEHFGDGTANDHTMLNTDTGQYADPVLNIVSATKIGKVFGGGLGSTAVIYGNPTVNINQAYPLKFKSYDSASNTTTYEVREESLGSIGGGYGEGENYVEGGIFGGGNEATVVGNTTINIGTEQTVNGTALILDEYENPVLNADGKVEPQLITEIPVMGANIVGNVYGGGNEANVTGNTVVNICIADYSGTAGFKGVSIDKNANGGGSVYGGGCSADVLGNTNVTMSGGYVFNGIFGGGYAGSVGTFTRSTDASDTNVYGHTTHDGCIGKPTACAEGTGKCTIVVNGGQIGPVEVATEGMKGDSGPVVEGWVWGGGQGLIEDPADEPDTHFKSYVGSTDVTIGGTAFILESIIGGGEFGRVLGNTLVKIEGGQIGVGANQTETVGGVLKPKRYTEAQFIDPTTTTVTDANALAECSHFDYGFDHDGDGKLDYLPYDPYYDKYKDTKYIKTDHPDLSPASTSHPSDGKTWIGCVFGGGSGYMPYEKKDGTGYDWVRSAGLVEGNSEVIISGGHILTNVYGGNEITDVLGTSKVTMTGGTIGVPRTLTKITEHPLIGNLFGAGKGDERSHFYQYTNVGSVIVDVSGGIIYGSVFGGSEDGHVLGNTAVNISGGIIGTWGTSYMDGNVFGGGRGFSGTTLTAGNVGGNVALNIEGGNVLGSVYGGGRLASVGTYLVSTSDEKYGNFIEEEPSKHGHITVNISGGTIGNAAATGDGVKYSGNVFGASMGRLDFLNGTRNPDWPKMAQVKSATVNISGDATVVRRSVYGGGELGTVRENTYVTIGGTLGTDKTTVTPNGSPTVRCDVYGGGYGSDDMKYTVFTVNELEDGSYVPHTYGFTPMQFAGCVGKNTYVNIAGGYVMKNVYGGGEIASVGVINYMAKKLTGTATSDQVVFKDEKGVDYYYTKVVKHADETKEFALSWPYKFEYVDDYLGATHVKVTGGRLGLKSTEPQEVKDSYTDNGDVYGAGKGKAGDYKDYLFCANVGSTDVYIKYDNTAAVDSDDDCISGAAYGGGEDGHVMGDTKLTIVNGLIGHSVYGAGSGKGLFDATVQRIDNPTSSITRKIYSITAGKVFGNSTVEMNGGHVVRNIYGGGNMGSVGKGNYAGGPDDYSTAGYGEKLSGSNNLWDNNNEFSKAFLNSGKCTVKITGGTVGYIADDPSSSMYPKNSSASLPYGNVFGGCRGESAPNITESPRYLYSPEFFVGYANETSVTIEGDAKILGSVYGGGMDGHVRRDASVIIKGGEIGIPYTSENITKVKTSDSNDIQWLARGNVYGSGSGIGKYKYDFNYDGEYTTATYHGNPINEEDYSTSAGSVTRFTKVDIQGGTIYRNVYGGGSLSSIGAPKIGQDYYEYRKGTAGQSVGKQTLNEVIISGGKIGDANSYDASGNHVYGGDVFGGSRGDAQLNTNRFSTSMFTSIKIDKTETTSPVIAGSVYGGGEVGIVKGSVDVTMNGGTVNHDVYGGGALANTNTENPKDEGGNLTSTSTYKTTVDLFGGLIKGDAYGGGLGRLGTNPVAAMVYGDVAVTLGTVETEAAPVTTATAFNITYYDGSHADVVKSGRVFGCNNQNGSPQGDVKVIVNKTVAGNMTRTAAADLKKEDATHQYEVAAVYGGGNLANYTAKDKKFNVIINRCDVSIREVYGGGNAAAVPGTDVLVNGAYEIESVFGGGNGKDDYWLNGLWNENLGANVNGNTNTLLLGGNIHEAYGGSNEKGTITGNIAIDAGDDKDRPAECDACPLEVGKIVGAGKNADVKGTIKMIMGCKPGTKIPLVYGGADNANVDGNVELTITSGHFGKVFGGNNEGGIIMGYIKLNIEETGVCETPITIDELYLGGNQAAYSKYGYYVEKNADGTPKLTPDGKLSIKPRESAMDAHKAIKSIDGNEFVEYTDEEHFTSYSRHPELNVISCTKIGTVFGGGYGERAVMYANPTVNINMIPGSHAKEIDRDGNGTADNNAHALGEIGTVYGGGNAAAVHGNTMVNIGTATSVTVNSWEYDPETKEYTAHDRTVEGAYVTGNIYGGGNLADVTGNTNVNICAKYDEEKAKYMPVVEGESKVVIAGDVYGGGKGKEDTFTCEKAMVGIVNEGIGSTSVNIGNGTVAGNVFGGGEVGRVEHDTEVTVGLDEGTSTPVVKGSVFGAGSGLDTHGYSALVRGSSTVIVQGNAKVQQSVYGGGEKASVGRYYIATTQALADQYKVEIGEPYDLMSGGKCTVIIQGNAEIGPDGMQMTAAGGPDDAGHVFGAGKGVLPYEGYDSTNKPWRMYRDDSGVDQKEYYDASNEADYFKYIKTLALNNDTEVTIAGNAFVKGSVYGGSENGRVRQDTKVKIQGGQIGAGEGMTEAYKETDWAGSTTPAGGWKECAHWTYDTTDPDGGKPYDKYAGTEGYDAKGGAKTATDGHTFYGNVFGGGSGYYPYAPGKWYDAAGQVYGNTLVEITGGHILTSVYGGCEVTDVKRNCTITMSGGTIGVPQTDEERQIHPVIGNIFGAGKGDKRILFNTWTNVDSTKVNVSGGTVYGNVYGGGEDGHVLGLAATTISGSETGTIIGITGTSGYDGNVFGGGRGSASALTAGVVGGNVKLNIQGGLMKASVYGGGRIASVGTYFAHADDPNYGKMQDGDEHGCIAISLTGGTINENVYGGCMGTTLNDDLGVSKNVTVELNNGVDDAVKGCIVKGSIFGCNNVNSSPLGDAMVHIYKTQRDGATRITNAGDVTNAKVPGKQDANGNFILSSFDVQAVYGGGNLAAYKPGDGKNTTKSTRVIIDGCDRTSIGHVYGGGNAASTPATNVEVNGTYEIGELFGGGNGKDAIDESTPNPGANVGFYNYSDVENDPKWDTKEKRKTNEEFISKYVYGSGEATVNIKGGTIHHVFGGSNTKGNVRKTALTMLEEVNAADGNPICPFQVDEAYGGGKSAPMDAEAKLLMACIPGLKSVYGGAQAADVYDDVTLTITNGNFDRVFGGNNISGTIRGRILVNIEETGCKPVIIGELYGGGNLAGYSTYGYRKNADGKTELVKPGDDDAPAKALYADPVVNVKSFTSIGNIFGGGYGEAAVMVGNPTVNINESVGSPDNYPTTGDYDETGFKGKVITVGSDNHEVTLPSHTKGKIGAINNVFGGGNAAKVIGNTNVNIGTKPTETYVSIDDDAATTDVKENVKTVDGADIRGNVYGGGNNAEVTGNTNVTIGKEKKE